MGSILELTRIKWVILLLLITITVVGCTKYTKPGGTSVGFERDKQECREKVERENPVTYEKVYVRTDTKCVTNFGTTKCTSYPVYQTLKRGGLGPLQKIGYVRKCLKSKGWK